MTQRACTCMVCGSSFTTPVQRGRPAKFCSAGCRRKREAERQRDSQARRALAPLAPLPRLAKCPGCGKEFRPGRPGGREQVYCSRLCNPRYGWVCTICGVVKDCGGARTHGGPGSYVCQPCRQAARPEVDPLARRTDCSLCGKGLSDKQQRQGNKFCSPACAYKVSLLIEQPLNHKRARYRRYGMARPFDAETGEWLQGPCRRQKLSVYVGDEHADEMSCPFCMRRLALTQASESDCNDCAVRITLDKPFSTAGG